ncbi:MAG TPA: transcription termination factor NusA [Planctomycetes bacterium]|nr:transcription termination factor NusA [Planctomycetota bacterium]HIN80224.1 transcription termination factor NusA [Planctomycetota bacterium]
MSEEILRFVDTIHRDRQVDKEVIFYGIEQALVSAAQKKYGENEVITINIDRETGEISAKMGGETFNPREALGRIAAGAGKQVLFQKIREAEREVIFLEYQNRVGELLNGTVASRKGGGLVVSLSSRAEGFMPRSEQSQLEEFREGDRIKVILKEVNQQPNRVQLLVSRASTELVKKLFEQEIPEVADYVVEIRAIAREAGNRTKVAVATLDQNVDCVGACIGVKGSRIRNVTDELSGEKIDVIRWNDSIEILMVEALKPAEVASLELDYESQTATVFVSPDQQSKAIGRRGQNVRLASKLTGWELNITAISDEELEILRAQRVETRADDIFGERIAAIEQSELEPAQPTSSALDHLFAPAPEGAEALPPATGEQGEEYEEDAVVMTLEDLPGVTAEISDRLFEAGLDSTDGILEAGVEGLAKIEGLDEDSAGQIINRINSILEGDPLEEQ